MTAFGLIMKTANLSR